MKITNHEKNVALYERARQAIPGGLLTNFKADTYTRPLFIEKSKGSRLWDFDGNEYIDFALTFGPTILGHDNERYKKAIAEQLEISYDCEIGTIQIECAEKIKSCIKGMDLLRFSNAGTEADYMAVRVARGYTGKNYVVKFTSHFHGGADYIVGGIVNDPANPVVSAGIYDNDLWSLLCDTTGRAAHALNDTMMVEFNNKKAIKELFANHGHEIAAVIMEPVPLNLNGIIADKDYMQLVRDLCTKHNAVMIFDEILTGFRIGLGGAAEFYGVQPDMWVFSKAITGGFPAAVYGGKKEIMDTITNCEVLAPGTFNGNPLGCAAMISVIDQLSENDGEAFKRMYRLGAKLREGFLAMAKKHNVGMIIQGFDTALVPVFTRKDKISTYEEARKYARINLYYEFIGAMKNYGILSSGRFCISAAHTDEDVDKAIEAADYALAEMKAKHDC